MNILKSKKLLHLLINDKGDGVGRDESDQIGDQPSVEPTHPVFPEYKPHNLRKVLLMPAPGIIHNRADDSNGVGGNRGGDYYSATSTFCEGGGDEDVGYGQPASLGQQLLQLLVQAEVYNGVADGEERGGDAFEQRSDAFLREPISTLPYISLSTAKGEAVSY